MKLSADNYLEWYGYGNAPLYPMDDPINSVRKALEMGMSGAIAEKLSRKSDKGKDTADSEKVLIK